MKSERSSPAATPGLR